MNKIGLDRAYVKVKGQIVISEIGFLSIYLSLFLSVLTKRNI